MGKTINRQYQTSQITAKILLMHTARLAAASLILMGAQAFGLDVQQTGTSNSLLVEQEYVFSSEGSHVYQEGEGNDVMAYQGGDGNSNQLLVTRISQTGALNAATSFQNALHGQIVIQQTGTQNHAQVEQQDIYAVSAEILQTGTNNFAELHQLATTDEPDQTLQASIVQEGSGNRATAIQHTYRGQFALTQIGEGNILQLQQGVGNTSQFDRDSRVDVEMVGDGNEAYIVQRSANSGALAEIRYIGSGNTLNLEQIFETPIVRINSINSDGNQDVIYQNSGGWHEVSITRQGTHDSRVDIYQDGTAIDAGVTQTGSVRATVELEQVEDYIGARSWVDQSNVIDSLARVEQGGTSTAYIVQSEVDNSIALIRSIPNTDDSDLTINQMAGTGNAAEIFHDGPDWANLLIEQSGSYNEALISHVSSGNWTVQPEQYRVELVQVGDHNTATIMQNF